MCFENGASREKQPPPQYIWIIVMSLGGLALGAGVYSQFVSDAAFTYAPYILATGVVFVCLYLLFGDAKGSTLHVGDMGIGFEEQGKTNHTQWYEVQGLELTPTSLRVLTEGRPLDVPLKAHALAAKRIASEALRRVPKRIELSDSALDKIGEPSSSEGERIGVDPPQVTNERCTASGKALTFEKDVRMCSRCMALYHRAGVPQILLRMRAQAEEVGNNPAS